MHKLILFNQGREDAFPLENAIEEQLSCFAERVSNEEDLKKYLEFRSVHLVIINCKKFDLMSLNLVNSLRSKISSVPILVVADVNEFPDFFNIENGGRSHIIYKPFNEVQFVGLAKKLLCSRKAPTQHFRRYRTDQNVDLELLSEGQVLSSKLCNLSLGGAYCEFFIEDEDTSRLQSGDLIRLNVPRGGDTSHMLNAKVVWKKHLKNSDSMGVGLKFIKLQDL